MQPTEELAFAGAHLYAYSYLYDKKVATTGQDVKVTFTIDMKDKGGADISMNLWMKGGTGTGSVHRTVTDDRRIEPDFPYAL